MYFNKVYFVLLMFLVAGSILGGNRSASATVFVSENWDTGTPVANWPGKRLGTTCDDALSFNGWTGRGFACDDPSGSSSGLSATQSHSGMRSFYQKRDSGHYFTNDLSHPISGNPQTIHLRFYLYLTANWKSFNENNYVHFIFTNTALSNTGFRLNLLGNAWNVCGGNKIIIDPGLGFGKTWQFDMEIIRRLEELKTLDKPILLGPSRKSFIKMILDLPANERVEGTAAAVAIAITKGADIVRVHDVKEMVRVCRVSDAIIRAKQVQKGVKSGRY